ncbi:AraC family transcriptional regulator [Chryseolinea sp. T2]|uniref:helix-turn-helix transcriptional regulator n=1 Tax=Chryseolinea sp. T2 TaxID=3129255 RepID=UPI00307695AF
MSVSLKLELDKVTVVGSPFNQGMPRQRVDFNIDPELGVFGMDTVVHKHFALGETFAVLNHDVTLVPPPGQPTHYGIAVMHSKVATVKFMDRDWFNVVKGEYHMTYNPGVEEAHRFKAGNVMKSHYIQVEPYFLNELLMSVSPGRNTPLWDFKEQVIRGEFANSGGAVSLPAFYQVIQNVFDCPLDGPLGDIMLEGSLHQLMALQFSMMGAQHQTSPVSHREQETFYAIKDHLRATFLEEHSLLALSRKFGINQNKLKTGFRELFGTPVISYLYDLRMDFARTLLLDKNMNVNEVSPMVGYRNANHFSTAFKRKFGISPSRLKY